MATHMFINVLLVQQKVVCLDIVVAYFKKMWSDFCCVIYTVL